MLEQHTRRARFPRKSSPIAVLVADHSEELRALASLVLGRRGFDVEHASSSKEALTKLAYRPFSAILVDSTNPHAGQSLLSEIVAVRPDLAPRMIGLTSVIRTPIYGEEVAETQLYAVISKPFDIIELVNVVTGCAAHSIAVELTFSGLADT